MDLSKDERITKEITRLSRIFTKIDKKGKAVIDGLIKRAAYMRITLEDMEEDLDGNGFTEQFSQSEKLEPYERERPVARLYNSMNKNFQSIMKQLSEFLPKEDPKPKEKEDQIEAFINSR